ncbi:MAG TPA: nuclear transport factor 2 family protein [Rubrobacter sp.]|nr:nuclear transport factor 2 family protein [Rubrobacter sp.]
MPAVLERLRDALNAHDPDAMLECFDPDYRSEQPAHPNRGFGGKDQVHKNWSGMFESFPDFEAEVLRNSSDGDVVWSEWHWSATGMQMAGVTVMGIRDDRISWARLYMEPVEEAGQNIDEAMRTITGRDRPGDEDPEDKAHP